VGDVVAQLGMWWLSGGCGSSVGGCGGSSGDVVAQRVIWWLSGGGGGSVEGDVVAQRGMWWLSWLRQLGDTRLRTQQSRVRIRLPSKPQEI
jgi:hypothetical protein